MSFGASVPKEDPAVAAARARQEQRADASLTSNIQEDLRRRMRMRLQRFGFVPGTTAAPSAASSVSGARPGAASLPFFSGA